MEEITLNVSWIGVVVGAVAAFLVGWLWYSPKLFGTKWAEGVGVEMGTAANMPVAAMATQALGLLLASWFVGVTAANEALLTFILAFVAFVVLKFSSSLFNKNSTYAAYTDAGYWLVSGLVMFIAQAIF